VGAELAPRAGGGPVVVVGGGLGGLAAAIRLGAAGRAVRLLEAGPRLGGKAGIAEIDCVEVDTGPSVLTMVDALDRTLALAGVRRDEVLGLRAPVPAFRYRYPGGPVLDVFPDPADTLDSVGRTLGVGPRAELAAFLDYARRIWDAAAPRFVYGPAPTVTNVLRMGLGALLDLPRIDPLSTMAGAIRRRVRSPELRALLLRYATYNGSDPRRAPATLNCIAHVELALGGFGVEGGVYAMVRALAAAAARVGVAVETGRPVRRLVLEAGRVAGVEVADGAVIPAAAVVLNADAALLTAGDDGLLPAGTRGALSPPKVPSTSGWTAILRARRRAGADARVAHEVLFPARYEAEFEDLFDRRRAPAEPTLYLCAQEANHGRRGWADDEPVFVMVNAPAEPAAGPPTPAATWEALADTVAARLRAHGLADPGDTFVWQRSPAGLAAAFPGSRGALYGAASNDPGAAFRRPPNSIPAVPGLHLASGSAHPGGGMPMALLSGLRAAGELLGDTA
jgi:1-hydroxycarotenoid 3,4-desaturase